MYQEKSVLFIYCISPVHMGAGTSVGVIDAPIQRERHTNHPSMAGSGIKGAIRHHLSLEGQKPAWLERYFGPENGDLHAGAVSFADAQVVLFPVRSTEKSFLYVTCPTAVARLIRLLGITGHDCAPFQPLETVRLNGEESLAPQAPQPASTILESFEFKPGTATEPQRTALKGLASFLKKNAIPKDGGFSFFQTKIENDILLVSDHAFNYFVRHSTSVEPHVKIDDASGTAKDGGLFYVENLPPETLMVSLFMATLERSKEKKEERSKAETVKSDVTERLDAQLVQLGGDATTGRGLVMLSFV